MADDFDPETSLVSEEELPLLERLRSSLDKDISAAPSSEFEEVSGDVRLLRFLRSFPTPDGAAEAYRTMLRTRAEHGMDGVRREILELGLDHSAAPHQSALDEHAPGFQVWDAGRTPSGDVLTVVRPANLNFTRLFEAITPEQLMENFRYNLEIMSIKLDRLSRESGRLVKMLRVQDMEGVSASFVGFMRRVVGPFVKDVQVTYAGCIRAVLLLNVPQFFSVMFGVISPLLNDNMRRRFRPHGADYKQVLLRECDVSVLRRLEEARAACPGTRSHGPGKASALVPAWGRVEVGIPVKRGDMVKWDLKPDGSLAFLACAYGQDGSTVEVKSVPDMVGGERGEYKYEAGHIGVVNLVFDNYAAWMEQRVVDYDIQLVEAT